MRLFTFKFLLFALFFPLITNGQIKQEEIIIEVGEKLRKSKRESLHQIIGENQGRIYALQTKEKRKFLRRETGRRLIYILQQFGPNLELINSQKLDLQRDGKSLHYQFIIQLDNSLYLFSSEHDRQSGYQLLYTQPIDMETLQPARERVQVAKIRNGSRNGYFAHRLSPDGSKLLIFFSRASLPFKKQELHMYVLGETLKRQWAKEVTFPFPPGRFKLESYQVDNAGNVYLLGPLFKKSRAEKRRGKPNYQYHLISYRKQGKEVNEYAIELADKFLTDLKLAVNDQQDIIGGGFYAEENSYKVKGGFFFTIDGNTNEVVKESIKEFGPGFTDENPGAFVDESKGKETLGSLKRFGFSLNDILLRKDGSAVLLGEQFSVHSKTRLRKGIFGSPRTQTSYSYHFNNIVLLNMNRRGEIDWVEKVDKQQYSIDDGGLYSSYGLKMLDDKLYMIFNPGSPAKAIGVRRKEKKPKATMVRVDKYGDQQEIALPEYGSTEMIFMPKTARINQGNDMVMLGGAKKANYFVRLKIKLLDRLSIR